METRACYIVQEKNKEKTITSTYHTTDYFMAMADVLLKLKKPLNMEIRRKIDIDKTIVSVDSGVVIYDFFEYINIHFTVFDKNTLAPLLTIQLDTVLVPAESEMGFTINTYPIYQDSSYQNSIHVIAKRLREWSFDDYDIARVLLICATRDSSHIFWMQRKLRTKELGR